jgi:RNA polymerase sigma factor (sigma-70 family)
MIGPNALALVVDDDPSVRATLRSFLRSVGMQCETFAAADELLRYRRPDAPTCLVLDVQLPGLSGLDLCAELARASIDVPIIFISGHATVPMSVRAMKSGAVEFLTKPFTEQELLDAIDHAIGRDRAARAARAEQEELRMRLAKLTPRERDVFSLVVAGRMNKEIAAQLGIVEQTIKQHRGRMMGKLGIRSVAELVRFAERLQTPVAVGSRAPDRSADRLLPK